MKLMYSILFACQLAMQIYLVSIYSTSPVVAVAVLALVLAAVQTITALFVIVSAQVNPPYKMPESGVAKRVGMFTTSAVFTLVATFVVLGVASVVPFGLWTTQFLYLLGSSVLAGSAMNSLFVSRLSQVHGA
ncbi:MAG: hypothetical protein K2Z81_09510 [Cyanobacteria bacterium]|nr:hypothetical protein [Cyanobacteriota bacterium]